MWNGGDGDGPQSVINASSCDDDLFVLVDLDLVFREEGRAVVIAELG